MSNRQGYIPVAGILLVLMAGACSSTESTQSESEPPSSATVDAPSVQEPARDRTEGPPSDVVTQLIRTALRTDGNISSRTLRRRLGPPQRIQTEPIANRYVQDQVDTLRTLVYSGVEALVYDVTSDAKTFLARLSVSATRYATPEGVRVGLSERRVIEKIGPPTRRNDAEDELIYQEMEPTPTSMVIHIRDGRVVRIDWEFYFT